MQNELLLNITKILTDSPMRAVIQRVDRACVTINHQEISSINKGILILLGVEKGDSETDSDYILEKAVNLRIFEDEHDKMSKSLMEIEGDMMVVSQFTLLGNCIKGRRPSFTAAEEPLRANKLYEYFIGKAKDKVKNLGTGKFQAMMKIEFVNDGPVTILLDSKKEF
jgi:D-aminoacyl-tRNA deacylase